MFIFDPHNHTFYSTFINDDAYFSGFGTKLMGNMTNANSVAEYFKSIDCSYNLLGVPVQKHTTNIEADIKAEANEEKQLIIFENRDGLTTKQSNIALVAWTADCVPVIFADKKNGVVGISHQGWKGTVNRMAAKMVQSLIASGAEKEHLQVAIGPSIGACCYDVKEDRVDLFKRSLPEFVDDIFQRRDEKMYLNLLYTNYLLLQSEGIPKEHIDFLPFCTKCDNDRFFSYRREADSHGNMISFIMKKM